MSKLLLKEAVILDEEGRSKTADIAIENDCIYKIGEIEESWKADRVIDAGNHLAIPGFVNTHTHASMTLLRSYADDMALMDWLQNKIWPIEAKMKKEDIYWGAMLAIVEMIKSGTTTFADMYGDMEMVAKAVGETGIRAVLSRGMIGVAPNGMQALAENEALYKEFHQRSDGRITVMFGPHAPYTCPPDFLKKVVSKASALNAEIHMHLAETKGEVEDCVKQYGKSPIALMDEIGILECGALAAHCVYVSKEDIAIMKKRKVRVAHNPCSNMKLASGAAPVTEMLEAGIVVGLGTDGVSSNNNLDMLEEVKLAALLHKVHGLDPLAVPAFTAVQMGTGRGAAALGLGEVTGKLAAGYKADITLFSMDSSRWYPRHDIASLLVYSANSSSVDTVIVNGRVLLDQGTLTTIDEERVLYETNRRAMALKEV